MSDGYSSANLYAPPPTGHKRVRLKNSIVVAGFPGKVPGDVFDVPGHLAFQLVVGGHAEEVQEIHPEVTVAPEVVQVREPEVENRDPNPQTQLDKPSRRKPSKSA